MSKVLKYQEFVNNEKMSQDFLDMILNPSINEKVEETEDTMVKKVLHNLSSDLRFNTGLVFTFGTGITLMMPIVQTLVNNSKLSIEPTTENMVLLCLTVIGITYLEESGNKAGAEKTEDGEISKFNKEDAQNLLEELKLRGIGNGAVKKLVECFRAISEFLKKVFRSSQYVINGLLEMLGYTSLMIPIMNVINTFIGNYDMTIDTFPGNLLSLGLGVTSLLSKQGINYLFDKLKEILKVGGEKIKKGIISRNMDIVDTDDGGIEDAELL